MPGMFLIIHSVRCKFRFLHAISQPEWFVKFLVNFHTRISISAESEKLPQKDAKRPNLNVRKVSK